MKKSNKTIARRDAARDLGTELLQAVRDIKAGRGRRQVVELTEAAGARQKLGVSQSEFAGILGVSVRTLQDWEQGRRQPSGAAKTLLKITSAAPKTVRKVLDAA